MNVIIHDNDLLLTQAIKYGLKKNVFDGSFIQKLREEGAVMTVKLAAEFYNAHYEANLRQAADIVLGICNLGAIFVSSDKDVQKIAILLYKEGLVKLFRRGFTRIKELSQKTQKHYASIDVLSIKECAELFAVNSNVYWRGDEDYEDILSYAQQRIQFLNFLSWVTMQNHEVDDIAFVELLRSAETRIVSMIISDVPIAVLNVQNIVALAKEIEGGTDEYLQEKIFSFCNAVPAEYMVPARNMCAGVLTSIFQNRNSKKDVLSYILDAYDVINDSDESVKLLATTLEQSSVEDIFDRMMDVESLELGVDVDISPYVDALMKKDISMEDIQHLITRHGGWQDKIDWIRFSFEEIEWLLENTIEYDLEIVEDIFKYIQSNNLASNWYSRMPIGLLKYFAQVSEMIVEMMPFCDVSAEYALAFKTSRYLPILVRDECYEYCYTQRCGVEHLLSLVKEIMVKSSEEDTIKKFLVDRISRIRKGFAQEPDVEYDDDIFFDKDLHDTVKAVLDKKLYEEVVKKLREE
jgi:hypothetical protein